MFKVMIALVLVLSLGSCSSTPCSKIKPYSDLVASSAAFVMSCKGEKAMQDDFIKYCEKNGLCKKDVQLQGPIALIVCPVLVPVIVRYTMTQLPADWKCTGTASEAALVTACNAIPF